MRSGPHDTGLGAIRGTLASAGYLGPLELVHLIVLRMLRLHPRCEIEQRCLTGSATGRGKGRQRGNRCDASNIDLTHLPAPSCALKISQVTLVLTWAAVVGVDKPPEMRGHK